MDPREARIECLRIADRRAGGDDEKMLALAGRLIALVETREGAVISGGRFADRPGTPTSPAARTAPPEEAPVIEPAKGFEGEAGREADEIPTPDGEATAPSGVRKLHAGLAETLQAIRNLDQGHGARRADIVAACDAGAGTVNSRLHSLKKKGLATCRGRAKGGRWFAIEPEPQPDTPPPANEENNSRTHDGPAAADSEAPPPARARDQRDWNLPAPQPEARQMRRCLGPDCGREFMSDGKGHRICPDCTIKVRGRSGGIDDAFGVAS